MRRNGNLDLSSTGNKSGVRMCLPCNLYETELKAAFIVQAVGGKI